MKIQGRKILIRRGKYLKWKDQKPYLLVRRLRQKARTMLDSPLAVDLLEAAECIEEQADRLLAYQKRMKEEWKS